MKSFFRVDCLGTIDCGSLLYCLGRRKYGSDFKFYLYLWGTAPTKANEISKELFSTFYDYR